MENFIDLGESKNDFQSGTVDFKFEDINSYSTINAVFDEEGRFIDVSYSA